MERKPFEDSELDHLTAEDIRDKMDRFLDIRPRRVLELRSEGKTLEEIGKILGVSGERVRHLEAFAKIKIRELLNK